MHCSKGIIHIFIAMLLSTAWLSCSGPSSDASTSQQLQRLVVGTMYSPTGFFILKGDTLGYDYDRIKEYAQHNHLYLEFRVGSNLNELIEMLRNGQIDIIATEVPNTLEYRQKVLYCGSINETKQILMQNAHNDLITDVTQLAGKEVYVSSGTPSENTLRMINSELGGHINIHLLPCDSIEADDLMEMVSKNKVSLAVVNSDMAQFNKERFKDIDITMTLGVTQLSSWAVSVNNQALAQRINEWSNSNDSRAYSKTALQRYFKKSSRKEQENLAQELPHLGPIGGVSPYDGYFKKYANEIGWDWRLLAAIACTESRFKPNAMSWANARGLMQVLPSTAARYGVSEDQLNNPEVSVRVAAKCLRDINKVFLGKLHNRDQRIKFVLAAYNAGSGHVLDAMALADKYDKNSQLWDANVADAILWKQSPQYYNDPVCQFGYCRGSETVGYVASVMRNYRYYASKYSR